MSVPSMKAVSSVRVNPTEAQRLYSESRHNGNPQFCGAGNEFLDYDQYGRRVNQYTVQFTTDAACGNLSQYDVTARLAAENNARPYVAIPPPGYRGGDTAPGPRRNIPRNVYGTGSAGFATYYPNGNMPAIKSCSIPPWTGDYPPRYDNSMDATQRRLIT